ncbi:hypothetical protein [Streptomyces palmae]|uniref:Uncharacterized protein n=1 Tax=Streptomyces palmae TaxID=1701085 RepID=A0A4Z0GVK5_9ACTN|nr:hypothetical protein [Streptomyces palmae]TGB01785.1 hypothetical protein E4099_20855 [Streptomyces palmae]
MTSPRRACPVCTRRIAVVGGRFARHDPPGRRADYDLVSCPGSRRLAPLLHTPALFETDQGPSAGQQTLF